MTAHKRASVFRPNPAWWLVAGFGVGAGLGLRVGPAVTVLRPLGDLFIAALTAAGPPVAVFALVSSLAALSSGRLHRFGLVSIAWFLVTALAATAVGTAIAFAMSVGVGFSLGTTDATGPVRIPAFGRDLSAQFAAFMLGVGPHILFWTAFLFLLVRKQRVAIPVLAYERPRLLDDCVDVTYAILRVIMLFAPIGVMALAAVTFARLNLSAAGLLVAAMVAIYSAQAVVGGGGLILLAAAGWRPLAFLRDTGGALITALATGSSAATVPVEIAAAEQRLGIDRDIVGLVIPLGLAVHKIGSAAFLAVVLVFAANAAGIDLNLLSLVWIAFLALLASVITPPISGGVLVALGLVAGPSGLPMAVVLIAATIPFGGKLNTPLNSMGRLISAAILARYYSAPRTIVSLQ